MKTSDVRLDVKLNKALWAKGIRNVRRTRSPGSFALVRRSAVLSADFLCMSQVPRRIRVQIQRKRNDDEDAKARA